MLGNALRRVSQSTPLLIAAPPPGQTPPPGCTCRGQYQIILATPFGWTLSIHSRLAFAFKVFPKLYCLLVLNQILKNNPLKQALTCVSREPHQPLTAILSNASPHSCTAPIYVTMLLQDYAFLAGRSHTPSICLMMLNPDRFQVDFWYFSVDLMKNNQD